MSRYFSEKYGGLVPYVPGEQPRGRSFVKLNTNESPFPPSPFAQRFAREAAGDLRLYSDPECRRLRETAAEYFGLAPDCFVFTNGSDEILYFAFSAYCDRSHPAVFADITYGFYKVFAGVCGVPARVIPLKDDFTLDPEDYTGAGGTVFIANPNAPTGIALPLSDIERIVDSNRDNIVVIDEAYVDFGAESAVGLVKKYPNLLVTQTFSKSRSLAGGRLGMGIACPELIRDIETLRYSTNPYNVGSMTQAAGIGALLDREYFEECRNKIISVRGSTEKRLRELGFECTDSSANFIFAGHPRVSGETFYRELRERGILVRHFDAPRISNRNRITVGSAEEMELFLAAAGEIVKAAERKDDGGAGD